MKHWLPRIIFGVFALWALSALRPPSDKKDGPALVGFGSLPAVENGRFQPLDSVGRNSLLQLREKQTAFRWLTAEEMQNRSFFAKLFGIDKERISASQWVAEMSMKPELADTRPAFRIDNPDLKGLLGLAMDADPEKQLDGKHFSWTQLQPKLEALQNEARRVAPIPSEQQTPYDKSVMRLWKGVGIYMKLQNMVQPQNARNWEKEYNDYLSKVGPGVAAARAQQAGKEHDKQALDGLVNELSRFDAMMQLEPPLIVPPHHPERSRDEWMRSGEGLMEIARGASPHFSLAAYARIATAFREGRVAEFNSAVTDYKNALNAKFAPELKKASREQWFNHFEPFYKALTIYVIAGILTLVYWVNTARFEWIRRTGVWLLLLALVVHSAGLIVRMVLEGRPPVTNLYSSAIFIGWGACVLGLILERFWRNGIGIAVSSTVGFLTLIIAHHLSLSGDTMEMMRAVLDTNFWLATHVVVVTLGYASTFVAGFLAIIFVIRGVFTKGLDGQTGKSLTKMTYGIICFATLFSFVGTVLGGIWADQSWGRFWGWDPKENGALMIVIWNATILHARWGGLVRERGLMNMAIFGNVITAWSWFGVNMLGIGLHSYGFMDAAFWWLMMFVASQIALIVIGSLPLRHWRSFGGSAELINDKSAVPA
jgi:ABC-type transport system involved in cytochrome c biogenesis permease subunit